MGVRARWARPGAAAQWRQGRVHRRRTVGHAWAVVFARAGYDVTALTTPPGEVADRALPVSAGDAGAAGGRRYARRAGRPIAGRVHAAASIAEAVPDTIYVQESVREDVAMKRQVFAEIAARACRCVLASSTSAIPGSAFLAEYRASRAGAGRPSGQSSGADPAGRVCGEVRSAQGHDRGGRAPLSAAGMTPMVSTKKSTALSSTGCSSLWSPRRCTLWGRATAHRRTSTR